MKSYCSFLNNRGEKKEEAGRKPERRGRRRGAAKEITLKTI